MGFANMSHELRTPMHAILGFSALGGGKVGKVSDEKLAGYFNRINESGQRLLTLLNGLLDLSKLEVGRMQFEMARHDILDTIETVIEEFTPLFYSRTLSVELHSNTDSSIAEFDNEKIIQVIRNLLSNAIKFTPDNKTLNIYLNDAVLPACNDVEMAVPAIAVAIKDQGPGIPEDELEAVFEKFNQSSITGNGAGGTGLGLTISKEIIVYHKGSISAANNEDAGVTSTFIIPRKQSMESVSGDSIDADTDTGLR